MLTDRDIVVKALAQGKDPGSTKAGELGQGDGKAVTIGADDSIDEALRTMIDHKVRRLPVIDGRQLVGIVSQADVATNVDEERVGDLIEGDLRRTLSRTLVGAASRPPPSGCPPNGLGGLTATVERHATGSNSGSKCGPGAHH